MLSVVGVGIAGVLERRSNWFSSSFDLVSKAKAIKMPKSDKKEQLLDNRRHEQRLLVPICQRPL